MGHADAPLNDTLHLAAQVIARCGKLASFSESAGSIRRTFLSPPMRDVHREMSRWLEPLGCQVRIDAVGNLRALYPATMSPAPRLLIGSHLDTVPDAGAYDGILGVVIAVALLEKLDGRKLPYAIEIVGFSEEEGVRFGVPFIGSRALVGRVDDQLLALKDSGGISVRQAIEQYGQSAAEITQAILGENVFAYLEFHIEQGPVLENLGLPLGAVEVIAGQTRLELVFLGRANHAGTTPMNLRFDAMACAAEWISFVERTAKGVEGLVATVGSVQAKPGTGNVIAAEVRVSLDVRHRSDDVRVPAVNDLIGQAESIATRRGLSVRWTSHLNQSAVAMDAMLTDQIAEAIRKAGCTAHRMVSGAGHDAMILAEKIPSAMVFLRTPGGISHDPAESVAVEDVAKAIACGLHLLDQLSLSSAHQLRTSRA